MSTNRIADGGESGSDRDRRARRRAFIREHHPDRGGDAGQFAAGLSSFDDQDPPAPLPRVFVVSDRPTIARVFTSVHRRLRKPPPRVR